MKVTENSVTVVHAKHNTEHLKILTFLQDTKFHYPVHKYLNVQSQQKHLSVLVKIFTVC